MKLREFVDKLKNFKPGEEITDMPAKNKIDPTKCAICKKSFKEGEKGVVSDVSGTQFHQVCFDKATNNDVLKKRRTDNQLPYGEDTIEEAKEKKTCMYCLKNKKPKEKDWIHLPNGKMLCKKCQDEIKKAKKKFI